MQDLNPLVNRESLLTQLTHLDTLKSTPIAKGSPSLVNSLKQRMQNLFCQIKPSESEVTLKSALKQIYQELQQAEKNISQLRNQVKKGQTSASTESQQLSQAESDVAMLQEKLGELNKSGTLQGRAKPLLQLDRTQAKLAARIQGALKANQSHDITKDCSNEVKAQFKNQINILNSFQIYPMREENEKFVTFLNAREQLEHQIESLHQKMTQPKDKWHSEASLRENFANLQRGYTDLKKSLEGNPYSENEMLDSQRFASHSQLIEGLLTKRNDFKTNAAHREAKIEKGIQLFVASFPKTVFSKELLKSLKEAARSNAANLDQFEAVVENYQGKKNSMLSSEDIGKLMALIESGPRGPHFESTERGLAIRQLIDLRLGFAHQNTQKMYVSMLDLVTLQDKPDYIIGITRMLLIDLMEKSGNGISSGELSANEWLSKIEVNFAKERFVWDEGFRNAKIDSNLKQLVTLMPSITNLEQKALKYCLQNPFKNTNLERILKAHQVEKAPVTFFELDALREIIANPDTTLAQKFASDNSMELKDVQHLFDVFQQHLIQQQEVIFKKEYRQASESTKATFHELQNQFSNDLSNSINYQYAILKKSDSIASNLKQLVTLMPSITDLELKALKQCLQTSSKNAQLESILEAHQAGNTDFTFFELNALKEIMANPDTTLVDKFASDNSMEFKDVSRIFNTFQKKLSQQQEVIFKAEYSHASKSVKATFHELQGLFGEDFSIPTNYKYTILKKLDSPEFADNFKEWLSSAKMVKDTNLANLAEGVISEISSFLNEIFMEKILPLIVDESPGVVKYMQEFSMLLFAKTGEAINTQMVTDLMQLALRKPSEIPYAGTLNRTLNNLIHNQEMPLDHLPPVEQKLAKNAYLYHGGYNLWVKSDWEIDESLENGLHIHLKVHAASINEHDSTALNKKTGYVTFRLNFLEPLTKPEQVAAFEIVQRWAASEKDGKTQIKLREGLDDFTKIPPNLRPIFHVSMDKWGILDSGNNPFSTDEKKAIKEQYDLLLKHSDNFRSALNFEMAKIFMSIGDPSVVLDG